MGIRPHPYWVRSDTHGLSHGLTKCPQDTWLHQCAHWCRPFKSLLLPKKTTPFGVVFFGKLL